MSADSNFPPRLFLIGAQKCATTFLADCLADHPQIELAAPKEPDFFTRNYARGLEWYRARFANSGAAVLLDASVSYTVAPRAPERDNPLSGVPERIRAHAPEARFVYIVRDPVQRVHSAYWHAVAAGHEDRPFRQAIAEDPWYLNASRYHHQVQRYLDVFPADRLLILDMHETIADPAAAVARVCRHVGLAPHSALELPEDKRNASYRLSTVGRMLVKGGLGREGLGRVARLARGVLPSSVYGRLRGVVARDLPDMVLADRDHVAALLREDTRRFAGLTRLRFDPASTSSPSPAPAPAPAPASAPGGTAGQAGS